MADRYFSDQPIAGSEVQLVGAEAHHLAHVMRAKLGDQVVVFDGSGREFAARVQRVGRSVVELEVLIASEVDRELSLDLTLAVALPKGDRQRWLIEKAVELGVTRVVPLVTERGVAQPADRALDRLRRTVIEASKQCGRNRLMTVESPRQWNDYVVETPGMARCVLAHPTATALVSNAVAAHRAIICAIGPEGGFSEEEFALATSHGWHSVLLGPRILRVETAALYLAALVAEAALATPT